MKKTFKTLAFFVATTAVIFSSCTEDIVDPNAPVITISSPTADTTAVILGESVDFVLELSSGNNLASLQTLTSVSGVEITNGSKTFTGSMAENITVNVLVSSTVTAGTVIEITFTVADGQKQTSVKKYIKAKAVETPLSAATNFEWLRVGGTAASGLDMFGLTWTSNTTTSAVIKKGATKFVELQPSDWTVITNMEALKSAIDAATDITQWEAVSAAATKTYDLTLGTIKDGKYFLIHVTNGTVTSVAEGTSISIKGQYKE